LPCREPLRAGRRLVYPRLKARSRKLTPLPGTQHVATCILATDSPCVEAARTGGLLRPTSRQCTRPHLHTDDGEAQRSTRRSPLEGHPNYVERCEQWDADNRWLGERLRATFLEPPLRLTRPSRAIVGRSIPITLQHVLAHFLIAMPFFLGLVIGHHDRPGPMVTR